MAVDDQRTAVRDQDWLRSVFNENYRSVLAYARRRVDHAVADDVVAETFLTAWRRRFDVPDGAERPWLFGVARNVIRNARRAHSRQRAAEARLQLAQPPQVHEPDASAAVERSGLLRTALGSLPEADREVLMLVAWEELSHAEIGQALGISANAVAVRVHRARKRLAARLGRHERAGSDESKVTALRDSRQAPRQAVPTPVESHRPASQADALQGTASRSDVSPGDDEATGRAR